MLTREIEWWPTGAKEPQKVRASIGLPEPHPSLGGYACTLTLDGFGERHSAEFHDEEGMIALTNALNMLPHVIEHLVRKAGGGRITSRLRSVEDQDVPEDIERELEYLAPGAAAPTPIKVTIGSPFQDGKIWLCLLTIQGFAEDHRETVQHVDTIGAVIEALYLAPAVLRRLVEQGGQLTYLGREELGFPVRAGG